MPKPILSILTKKDAEELHSHAIELLSTVGIAFEDWDVAKILIDHGCLVKDRRILIPEELVKESLRSVPKKFDLYDRDGKYIATLGEGAKIFNPGSAAIRILDYGARVSRPSTIEDLKKLVLVVDYLENIEAQSTALVPDDIPIPIRDIVRLYPILKYSRKPIITGTFTVENLSLMLEMLKIVREDAWRRPFAIFDVCPTPPLSWSRITSRNLIDLAKSMVPAEIISMPGLGATAPATIAGAIVIHHAEVFSGIVLSQVVSKGAPIIYGGSPTLTEPRYGLDRIVAPEAILISLGYRDMARYLDLPSHGYMGLSDNKLIDYQGGAETAYSALISVLASFDIISGPGMLENETTQSLEKLVIDNEICGIVKKVAKGFDVGVEEYAIEVIRDVVLTKDRNFLRHPHTRKYIRREVLIPKIWDVLPRSQWLGKDIYEVAHEAVNKILKEYTPPMLPIDILKELDEFYTNLFRKIGSEPKIV